MIRKFLLPAVAVAALAGCVTPYGYRQGNGDYYYGAPSVEYRDHSPYGYGPYGSYGPYGPYRYGYPPRSSWSFGLRYGYPYGYGYYPYGYPYGYRGGYYGGYPYGYPRHYRRPGSQPQPDPTPDNSRSPWRNLDQLRRRQTGGVMEPPRALPQPEPSMRRRDDSAAGAMIRRAQERERDREETP